MAADAINIKDEGFVEGGRLVGVVGTVVLEVCMLVDLFC